MHMFVYEPVSGAVSDCLLGRRAPCARRPPAPSEGAGRGPGRPQPPAGRACPPACLPRRGPRLAGGYLSLWPSAKTPCKGLTTIAIRCFFLRFYSKSDF